MEKEQVDICAVHLLFRFMLAFSQNPIALLLPYNNLVAKFRPLFVSYRDMTSAKCDSGRWAQPTEAVDNQLFFTEAIGILPSSVTSEDIKRIASCMLAIFTSVWKKQSVLRNCFPLEKSEQCFTVCQLINGPGDGAGERNVIALDIMSEFFSRT